MLFLYSEMFNRLCEIHLDTESDGEQDFLAAFVNYKPGKTAMRRSMGYVFTAGFLLNTSVHPSAFKKVIVQKRTQTNAVVKTATVSVPI